MRNLAKLLVVLSALGFALAVVAAYTGTTMQFVPHNFSRASENLALLAIAVILVFEVPSARTTART
jgi:amino acid permease